MLPIILLISALGVGFGLFKAVEITGQNSKSGKALGNGTNASNNAKALVSPQVIATLSQPYRGMMAEAVTTHRDIQKATQDAPKAIQSSLFELEEGSEHVLQKALLKAKHASRVMLDLSKLDEHDPNFEGMQLSQKASEMELQTLIDDYKQMRSRVYGITQKASEMQLEYNGTSDKGLSESLLELESLEQAMKELE